MAEQCRTIVCDFPGCGRTETEPKHLDGWKNWSSLHGINLNGNDKPVFCPGCTRRVMHFIDPNVMED